MPQSSQMETVQNDIAMICYKQQTPANPCIGQNPRVMLAVKSSKRKQQEFCSFPKLSSFHAP